MEGLLVRGEMNKRENFKMRLIVGYTMLYPYVLNLVKKHPQYVLGYYINVPVSCFRPGCYCCLESNNTVCILPKLF